MDITLTLLGEMITFALLIWFTVRYIWPPVTRAMEIRQATIAQGLEDAKQGSQFLAQAKVEAQILIDETKQQIKLMRDEAASQINQLMDHAKQDAENEKARIVQSAQAEITAQTRHARDELTSELADLVQQSTLKVLQSQVNAEETQRLVDTYLTEREH